MNDYARYMNDYTRYMYFHYTYGMNYIYVEEERPSKIKLYRLKNEKSNYDKLSIYLKARRKSKNFIDDPLTRSKKPHKKNKKKRLHNYG